MMQYYVFSAHRFPAEHSTTSVVVVTTTRRMLTTGSAARANPDDIFLRLDNT